MFDEGKIWFAQSGSDKVCINPKMANRHGLITGPTGSGKTITLKVLAESFSNAGVPVFLADVKGDLSGTCRTGTSTEGIEKRLNKMGIDPALIRYQSYPCAFWDVLAQNGIPLRTTVSEIGPILMAKILELNATQSDILSVIFKIADDNELLLIDTKDLKAIIQYVGDHADELSLNYGNMPKASLSTIVRHIIALETQGSDSFIAEPALNIADWFNTSFDGKGTINILDCRELIENKLLYSSFMLWMLSELYEVLPEVGDLEKPRIVFFFDESHLLFKGITKALEDKVEKVVRLIRSKGVGIYFITQNESDITKTVLSQLNHRIQHGLPGLGIGEAKCTVLDESGSAVTYDQAMILPPLSMMGAISEEERRQEINANNLSLKYKDMFDRDSAYEFLIRQRQMDQEAAERAKEEAAAEKERQKQEAAAEKERMRQEAAAEKARLREETAAEKARLREEAAAQKELEREEAKKKKAVNSAIGRVASSAGGTIGRELGNAFGSSIGGSFGKRLGGNLGASLGRSILGNLIKR